MRVLIADGHPIYRDGLRRVLELAEFAVVGEVGTGRDAIELTRRLHPDIVLLDLRMSDAGGVDAIRTIHDELPAVILIVLTASSDDRDIVESIQAGAQGYLSKEVDRDELVGYLQRAVGGEAVLAPGAARTLFSELGGPSHQAHGPGGDLTEREREVVQLLFAGVTSTRALADRLVVTPNTVRSHLNNIFRKLQVRDKAQAVAAAVHLGLVETGFDVTD